MSKDDYSLKKDIRPEKVTMSLRKVFCPVTGLLDFSVGITGMLSHDSSPSCVQGGWQVWGG
jgi:hypothetical protein